MESYLAGLKTRLFGRVATIFVAFSVSAAFIFILIRLTPGDGIPELVKIGGASGTIGGPASVGAPSLQACSKSQRPGSADILRKTESKYAHLADDKFTIAMLTYKRPKELNQTLTVLLTPEIPSLYEIVIIWNDLESKPPANFVSEHGVTVRYRASTKNSLNQKLLPDPAYTTQAILLSDDDVYYQPSDLEFVFQSWRKFGRNRLTGALARCTDLQKDGSWKYGFCSNKEAEDVYSMIITNLAFAHISFLDYYSSDDAAMVQIRQYIDEHLNCEDIALNFVASLLTCSGPLQVKGRAKYFNSEPPTGISRKPGHLEARTKCLNHFTEVFGTMPLVNEGGRIERGVLVSMV